MTGAGAGPGGHPPASGGRQRRLEFGREASPRPGASVAPNPTFFAPKLISFVEELRAEEVAVGTSEILDAFAAIDVVPWTNRLDFREALAATLVKSQRGPAGLRPRLRSLVLPRRRARGDRARR